MKRFLILALMCLCACSSTDTKSPASFFDLEAGAAILSMDSTSEQIQQAMLESATRWTTVQMNGTMTWYAPDGTVSQVFHEQTWIDQLNSRYKSELTGVLNSSDKIVKVGDGINNYNGNLVTGQVETFPFPDSARVGQYVPPLQEGVAYPNPLWGQIGTPLSELAFSANFAQNKGTFKSMTIENVANREALIAEWTYVENASPSWRMWLDTRSGTILKLQEFGKDGSSSLQGERIVMQVIYNQTLDNSLFSLPAGLPEVSVATGVGSEPLVSESGSTSAEDAGQIYFFLQPRQAGQSIQLARVSGICVTDQAKCPPLEIIKTPFPFNFTISALSWSADGSKAAFAYSDNANGTPQKLFIFDPLANSWTSMAQFPYIDPPFWSPDGNWIAFRTQDGVGGEDVYVMHGDGSELKSISANLPADGRPYIMDGWYTENIVMRSALPAKQDSIYLVRAADGMARPMFSSLIIKSQFVTSPDASLLAYDDYDANSQKHVLKVMEPDGANAISLTEFAGGSLYPLVWSPDSNLLAFNHYMDFAAGNPGAEVYVVRRDGSRLAKIYQGLTVGRLLFSPSRRYLMIEETNSPTGGHLFLIDLATLEQKILQAPGLSTDYDWYAPSWQP